MVPLSVDRVTDFSETLLRSLETLLPQLSPRLGAPTEERLRAMLAQPATVLFAARTPEGVVGVLALTWYDVPSWRKAWIEDVVVDAAARGLGVGEALVRAAQRYAAGIGAERVMLTSNPSRTAARALYRKCGFKEAETTVFVCKTDTE